MTYWSKFLDLFRRTLPVFCILILPGHALALSVTEPATSTNAAALSAGVPSLSTPSDPTSGIPWSAGFSGVADVQAAFNNARAVENSQLGLSLPLMSMPSQAEWNNLSDGEKALWLINRERLDRGLAPLHGLEPNVMGVAQYYADYLLDNNSWGHNADGRSPWDRMNANPAIGACHDFLPIGENLAVFVSSGSGIPLPIERTVYMWLYDDCCSWGHRHAILYYPYTDNSGPAGSEGFLGIGRANGGPYQGPFSQPWPLTEMIVMNVFDPCSSWKYSGDLAVRVAGTMQGSYPAVPDQATLVSYTGLNNGPVKIESGGPPIVASQRVAYTPDSGRTWPSFSELMGLPANQLTTSYILPWYNNADLNTQLRFGNVGSAGTNVTVIVGGVVRGSYFLAPNQSTRVSYPGLDSGPVVISSSGNVPIIASERVAYFNGSAWTSFSELMGLPANKLTTSYVLPWYNNAELNTQLRFGNVGNKATHITVSVGGVVQGIYYLAPNQSTRVSYAGINNGPVLITSSGGVPIIASERVAYFDGSAWTEFSELMALPSSALATTYLLPYYNNAEINTQLRFGNVGSAPTNVTVTVGGVVQGTYYLGPSQSTRVSYADLVGGPIKIMSSGGVPIIASERVAYFDGSDWTSFSELMGLPANQLTTSYIMPWYNNAELNTQLRFATP